jgi:hypothetical protein
MSSPSDLPPHPIDAVITWVDGTDPRHFAKRQRVETDVGLPPRKAAAAGYQCIGEVGYCVRSLLRFAPFLRRIHIITDDQVPPVMAEAANWQAAAREKLSVVDHRDIFAGHEEVLPTFNCRPIETMIHRVPGLAEHFVYLNDDFTLIRPVRPADWFRDGRPVLRGRWWVQPERRLSRRLRRPFRGLLGRFGIRRRASFHDGQAAAARLLGCTDEFFAFDHHPHPLRRSTFERFFAAHPEVLAANLRHRIRDAAQFNPIALAGLLELQAQTAWLEPHSGVIQMSPGITTRVLEQRLRAADDDARMLFMCVQNLGANTAEAQRIMIAWWDRVIGRDLPASIS